MQTLAFRGLISLCLLICLASCQTASKKDPSAPGTAKLSFNEFQKVLSPRSKLLPLPGGNESLILLAAPGDAYAKIYTLDHASGSLKLRFDFGRNISHLTRDHRAKYYYLHADHFGDENYSVLKYDPTTNAVIPLFGMPGAKSTIQDFSPDGESLYVLSNFENKAIYSLYKVDRETGLGARLTDGKTSFDWAIVSEDGNTASLNQAFGNNETHLWLLDLSTKKARRVLSKKATNFDAAFFHPNNKELYLNSNDGRDRMGCAKIAIKGPARLTWVQYSKDKDTECHYSRMSKLTSVTENFDGQVRLRLFSGVLEKEHELPIPERSLVSAISNNPDDSRVYVLISRADDPGDFFRFELKDGKQAKLERISKLNLSSIPAENFAHSYDLKYKSFDGMEIHAIVYAHPNWLKDSQKRPVIVWPHGGPDGHEMHAYHPFFQYWTMNGYVVVAPNFRGSTGYGKKFETLNDRDWGGGHIKDLIWAKRALSTLPYADTERVFIVGASFGGFSTLSAITQYPEEFKGAVAIVALANLFTFYKSIPPDPAWQAEFKTEMGDPVKDKKLYEERSPYFHAEKIKTPLKIYQAENDVRTVKAEMDEFVKKLGEHKIPVEYEVLLQEGHGFTKTETWQKVLQGTVEFLNKIQ